MKKTLGWMYGAMAAVIALGALAMKDAVAAPPGPEVCQGCHEAYFQTFSHSVHGNKDNPRAPVNSQGCANCHGDGTKHVEAGGGRGVGGIVNPSSNALSAEQKDKICLTCHEANRHLSFWDSGKHRKNDVSCTNCHSTHSDRDTLLKITNPQIAPLV